MGKAPKSFKKYVRKTLKRELPGRAKKRKQKREKKERYQKRVKREEEQDVNEEEEHRKTIQDLQKHDPELHKYLKTNEPDVLGFGDELAEGMEGDESDDDDANETLREGEREDPLWAQENVHGSDDESIAEAEAGTEGPGVTIAQFQQWLDSKRLKYVCLAFRSAVAFIQADKERQADVPASLRVSADSAKEIVAAALRQAAPLLDYHCKRRGKGPEAKMPHLCSGYLGIKGLIRSFIGNVIRLLSDVLDTNLVTVVLNSSIPLCPYLAPWMPLKKLFLKRLLRLVGHDEENVRFQAFLNIREMARTHKHPFADLCMKGLFLTLVRTTKTFTRQNLNLVAFLMNCVVVLWGEDVTAAYQQAFVYIRQLAIYLRTALKTPSQETFRLVYHWQFVNSYRVLSMVVCQYLKPNELWPLVYPLCQVGTGVLDLFPSSKCFPLHLNIIGILNRIARASGVYIPTPPYLLRILCSSEFLKKYKRTSNTVDPPDLVCTLRAKTSAMSSVAHHAAILREALYYLVEHFSMHAHAIGFPELAFPATMELSAMRRKITKPEWQQEVKETLREIQANATFIKERRRGVTFGPKDTDKVAVWESEAKAAAPPLVRYYEELHQQRNDLMQAQGKSHERHRRKMLDDAVAHADDDQYEKEDGASEAADDNANGWAPDAAEGWVTKQKSSAKKTEAEEDLWDEVGKRGGRRKGRKQNG